MLQEVLHRPLNLTIQISLNDQAAPTVTGTTVASNNTTIAVTFNEAVFDTNGGSGALEVSDFALSISGGVATVNATPSSISISGNVYTLGLNLSGTPNGAETLTVVPSGATAIYDAAGNAASTTQSNNTVSLNKFVSTWAVSSGTFELPLKDYANITIDWGDSSTSTHTNQAFPTHTYSSSGTYTITIAVNRCGKRYWRNVL